MKKIKLFIVLFLAFTASFYVFDRYAVKGDKPVKVIPAVRIDEPGILNKTDLALQRSSNDFFNETLLRSRFNGAILVARSGRIVFEKYNGLKQLTDGDPIDSTTAFHLASVSKTITAMAILKLWEEGKLNLDKEISTYLNTFPYKNITVRNLLNHRSGLPNYLHFVENLGWNTDSMLTNQSLLDLMVQYQKKLHPGRANAYFDYCNTNYALLALIVEKVSKLSFGDYLDITFFKPIGMQHSFVFTPEKAPMVLPSYKFNNRLEPFTFLDGIYGDKNIYSTPRDLLKWNIALNNGSLFSEKTLDEAFKGYSYEKKGIRNYGLGWRLYEMPSGKKIIYHNGWWHGNNTVFMNLPADSTTIVVLGNKYNRSIYRAKKIAGVFDGYGIQLEEDD